MSQLEDFKDDIKQIIDAAQLVLDSDEYEQFSEYTDECLAGQV